MAEQKHSSWSIATIGMALLASSCCVIQLVLNMLSISCAGFAVLTPYRPWFTLATLATMTLAWQRQKKNHDNNKSRRVLFWTGCVAAVLLASPELVRYMNESASTLDTRPIVLELDGLGCLACANKIKQGLKQVPGVADALVFFDNSTALVKCNAPCAVPELVKTVEQLGSYRAWVVSK
ncbi:hypothetical protein BCR43DRAFT_492678 [Syncephalastrum racemosum]|uniref:HMA domain-containing protein n=1 Tax=Syncephalastrum racemosum TaxID=13706 RepID=A0A1X2H9A8_SYNRA|nr:hypothetical protein BCR43DRAFT_492678 [Syncephalastrum racemosum]